jgi:hypothetical protein
LPAVHELSKLTYYDYFVVSQFDFFGELLRKFLAFLALTAFENQKLNRKGRKENAQRSQRKSSKPTTAGLTEFRCPPAML